MAMHGDMFASGKQNIRVVLHSSHFDHSSSSIINQRLRCMSVCAHWSHSSIFTSAPEKANRHGIPRSQVWAVELAPHGLRMLWCKLRKHSNIRLQPCARLRQWKGMRVNQRHSDGRPRHDSSGYCTHHLLPLRHDVDSQQHDIHCVVCYNANHHQL